MGVVLWNTMFGYLSITSEVALGTFTASIDGYVAIGARMNGLNGAAATFTVVARHKDSNGVQLREFSFADAKRTATDTTYGFEFAPFLILAGEKVEVRIDSTNSADTSVAGRLTATMAAFDGSAVASVTGAVGSVTGDVGGSVMNDVKGSVLGTVGNVTSPIILAPSQPYYAPAKAGDKMDLVDSPNATAVAAIANAVPGQLTGASEVTLTFHDADGNPVPLVLFTIVGQGTGQADSNGVATFGLADGTYTVVSRPVGLTLFSSTTLVVTGSTSQTIHGESASIPTPPAPSQAVGYLFARSAQGAPLPGDVYSFAMISLPATAISEGFSSQPFIIEADDDAMVYATVQKGATYSYWRSKVKPILTRTFTVPNADSFGIPAILG